MQKIIQFFVVLFEILLPNELSPEQAQSLALAESQREDRW